jgi:hypothetical protein
MKASTLQETYTELFSPITNSGSKHEMKRHQTYFKLFAATVPHGDKS